MLRVRSIRVFVAWALVCAAAFAVEARRTPRPIVAQKALLARIQKVPGEDAMSLHNFIQHKFVLGGDAQLDAVLGAGATHASLVASFAPVHAHAELRPENLVTVPLRSPGDGPSAIGLIGLVTSRADDRPLGYFIRTLHGGAHRWDELDYIAVDLSNPSAKDLGKALRTKHDAFLSSWGSAHSDLTAAWLGRLVWAKAGYEFSDAGERERARRKLVRFQRHFGIADADLFFAREGGVTEPFTHARLRTPADFAALRSTKGKVTVPVMESAEKIVPQTLEVGAAFLLGNHFDEELGQLFLRKYHATRPN